MRRRAPGREETVSKANVPGATISGDLFERLRALRRELASAQNVPPYIVFTDAALYGMCSALPKNKKEFLAIAGVGQVKLEKYGDRFLQAIREWLGEKDRKT
jgi:ATP-dependent DNA helicase RecQ